MIPHARRVAPTIAVLTAVAAGGLTHSPPAPDGPALTPLPTSEPTLVVATDGDDDAPGTVAAPLATIHRAVELAGPGDVIAVREGVYRLTTNITIDRDGTPDAPITLTSYPGEHAVIDGDGLPASHTPIGGSIPRPERGAIHQEASHWHITDLEIIRGPYGIYCSDCDDNVFANLVTRDNYESGFQLQGESSRNLILDLDSYGNHDPRKNGESADGLAIKEGRGEGNVVRGARLWNNADDGFDAWMFESPITIEDSVAWGNGENRWGFPDFEGDGNGFKLGGGSPAPAVGHQVRNSIAFDNAVDGFEDNGNPGAHRVERSTAYRNGGNGFDLRRSPAVLIGNLAVGNASSVSRGTPSGTGNSWSGGQDWTAADLLSVDPAILTGPRSPDGSVPSSDFLVPADGSPIGARF
ncbi:DUF1565 domain-containing protein [Actinoalloteichus sp. AHMU CJ021]|uniref:right-handed parallel beta-helix repeat-containing protein n=1 Tax=Actinoalloteichus TaxID=65496 RepID=UPI0004AA27EE|nr:right-handed parallel beta-helix repeat-containing protein [Actinoalloteichus caeruleus]AUS80626.1 DUF1565 domain-containing protein [Actinoalloteichus sp. AHMU CJ021]